MHSSLLKNNIDKDFLENLSEYISYKSISTDNEFQEEIDKTVSFLENYVNQTGGKTTILKGATTNPVLFAEYHVDDALQTLLVYGHYDVQPAGDSADWSTSNPFVLEEKNDRLIGRGIVDNKGQNFIHLHTVAKLFQEKNLGFNVKFLIEGNEESGNDDLPVLLEQYKELLTADHCIVSDGEIVGDHPVLEKTLRGGGNIKITLTTSPTNLHSGLFGGGIPSSSTELIQLLGKIHDVNGQIAIPGFFDGGPIISQEILDNNALLVTTADPLVTSGAKSLRKDLVHDFYTHTGLLPTIEISGIASGYTGNGFANILPGTSEARINIRTVPPQKTTEIINCIVDFLKKNIPDYVDYEILVEDHGDGCVLDTEGELGNSIKQKLESVYQNPVLMKYVGGSIPILKDFQTILGIQVISVSLGNDDCNMHGRDENFKVGLISKGLVFSRVLFQRVTIEKNLI